MGHIFRSTSIVLLAVLAVLVASIQPGQAQSLFERLVLPGELISGHAELQKNCQNCHTSFSQGAQSRLCVDCHKDVGGDTKAGTGFHGKSPEVAAGECRDCHTDHIGADASIVDLDRDLFDHNLSDFALNGAHRSAACGQCHETDKPFRQAAGDCATCHKEDEPHRGQLGQDCANCHDETNWTDVASFDHSKTDFPLKGAHKMVNCSSCHVGEVYQDLPSQCVDCHRIQDVHQDRFGSKCADCHTNTKWTEVTFDHGTDTDFALDGKHRLATCNSCHQSNVFQHETPAACIDCHADDDAHEATLGTNCAACHSTEGWLQDVRFDHDLTNFPLIGLHVVATCEECHSNSRFSDADPACQTCHRADDIHQNRLGPDCGTCHNPNGWAFWIFDHDRQTEFNLTGAHDGLKCATCHTASRATSLNISQSCVSCHRNDDIHRGAFGAQCARCHSTSSFKGARLR